MSYDGLMHSISHRILNASVLSRDRQSSEEFGIGVKFAKVTFRDSGTGAIVIPGAFESANFSAQFLKEVIEDRSYGEICIVLDEFDRLPHGDTRASFADLIKAIHDKSVPIRLICCGVADNIK